jgi:2-amino-4-hydroxy-6-hydroxymethyldihydropteridine diphosphokinase
MEQVYIGFGSNMGDSLSICRAAVELLGADASVQVTRVSSLYRSKPVGMVDQDWFINGVVQCGTVLDPHALLGFLQGIEARFGRTRFIRWGPRTLDLDILACGTQEVYSSVLTIPHPRLHERLFVLAPLAEIAPTWTHPSLKQTARELLAALEKQEHGQAIEHLGSL